jgi:hypothetical protein
MITNIIPSSVTYNASHAWLNPGFKRPVAVADFTFKDSGVDVLFHQNNFRRYWDFTCTPTNISDGVTYSNGRFYIPTIVSSFTFDWTGETWTGSLVGTAWQGGGNMPYQTEFFDIIYGQIYNAWTVEGTGDGSVTSSDDWVVPAATHFKDNLSDYLIAEYPEIDSTNTGKHLKLVGTGIPPGDTHHPYWYPHATGNGVDTFNFSAAGAGSRSTLGVFGSLTMVGGYWRTDNFSANKYYARFTNGGALTYEHAAKIQGYSIRLVRVATAGEIASLSDGDTADYYVGNDGQKYETVYIGGQVWTRFNLCETKFRNGTDIPWEGADGAYSNAEWAALTTAARCPANGDNAMVGTDVTKTITAISNGVTYSTATELFTIPAGVTEFAFTYDGVDMMWYQGDFWRYVDHAGSPEEITENVIYHVDKFLIPYRRQWFDKEDKNITHFRFDDGEASYDVDLDGANWTFTEFSYLDHTYNGSITNIDTVNVTWEYPRFRIPNTVTEFEFNDAGVIYKYEWIVSEWVLEALSRIVDYVEQVAVANIDPASVTFADDAFTVPWVVEQFAFADNGMNYAFLYEGGIMWVLYELLYSYTAADLDIDNISDGVAFAGNQFTIPAGVRNFTFDDDGTGKYAYWDSDVDEWKVVNILESQVDGDYYVAAWGDDTNTGAYDQPFATWQKAFDTADAGDVVYFRGGVYYPTQYVTLNPAGGRGNSGTINESIDYFNYPGESPVLDAVNFTSTTDASGLDIRNTANIKLRGLTVRNVKQRVFAHWIASMQFSANGNLHLENLTCHSGGGYGIWFVGYDTLHLINCDSYNHIDYLANDPGNRSDGYQISSGGQEGDYLVMTGCRAWGNSDDGIEISHGRNMIVANNWAFDNGKLEYGAGLGLKFAGAIVNSPNDRLVNNNIAAYNRSQGFAEQNLTQVAHGPMMTYSNNISYKNYLGFGSSIGNWICDSETGQVIYYNNLVYNSRSSYYDQSYLGACVIQNPPHPHYATAYTNTFNLTQIPPFWSYNSAVNWAYEGKEDQFLALPTDVDDLVSILSAPRKADGSLPDIGDMFRLAPDSDLKGAGTDVGMSATPDIGIDWDYIDSL